jgi:GalNAc-alpha-(1->4)-GalNAc-alpha-(1->3)-diNAcBac-PP-undecaprenol alpha-1,4-N-acetyl-D-galactosaminyltransferase
MNRNSYDLIFVMPHMGPGGSQRVASYLLNYWASRGRRLCLVTLYRQPSDAYTVDSRIDRICVQQSTESNSWSNRLQTSTSFIELVIGSLIVRLRSSNLRPFLIYCLNSGYKILKSGYKILNSGYKISAKPFFYLLLRRAPLSDEGCLNICQIALGLGGHQETLRRIKRLRSLFKETNHDVVLSFLGATNLQTIIAGSGNEAKLVISERNDPAMQKLAFPWEQFRKLLYAKADVVTANSRGAIETMKSFVPSEKLVYVPNPVIIQTCSVETNERRKIILYVGRLVKQKGVDILIEAFARISHQISDWGLEIVGDGPMMCELEGLADRRGIQSKVTFHGYKTNVHDFYRQASIFALPSRYEGTPNALIEAICWGLPVVTSDASPGPLELVRQEYNGLIFPSENTNAMADALLELATNKRKRKQMSLNSRKESRRFELESAMREWEMVLFKP